jgi:hypothetical protein
MTDQELNQLMDRTKDDDELFPIYEATATVLGERARPRRSSAAEYDCLCGYQGETQQDLDEHIVACSRFDNEEHVQTR